MDSKISAELTAIINHAGAGRLPWQSARVAGELACVDRAEFRPTLDVRLVVELGPGIVPSSPLMARWHIEHPDNANPSKWGVYVAGSFDGLACFMVQTAHASWVPEVAAVISRLLHDDSGSLGWVGGTWAVRLAVAFKPAAFDPAAP